MVVLEVLRKKTQILMRTTSMVGNMTEAVLVIVLKQRCLGRKKAKAGADAAKKISVTFRGAWKDFKTKAKMPMPNKSEAGDDVTKYNLQQQKHKFNICEADLKEKVPMGKDFRIMLSDAGKDLI